MLRAITKRDAPKRSGRGDRGSPPARTTAARDLIDRLGNTAMLRMLRARGERGGRDEAGRAPTVTRTPTAGPRVQRQSTGPGLAPVVSQQSTPQPVGSAQSAQQGAAAGPAIAPAGSAWSFAIPYIHFDLLDRFAARYYSAYVGLERNDNPNFGANLNPGPVRTPSNARRGGPPVTRGELGWVFYTKFYVDSPSAPFPGVPGQLHASANVRYETLDHRVLFDQPFDDPQPQYLSPLGTHAYYLATAPRMFPTTQWIDEEGDLLWDAKLVLSTGHPEPGFRVEFQPPFACIDPAAFMAQVRTRVASMREAAVGEPAWIYRVSITRGPAGAVGRIETFRPDGQPGGNREFTASCEAVVGALRLGLVLLVNDDSQPSRNNMGTRVIRGSQRVPFRNPAADRSRPL